MAVCSKHIKNCAYIGKHQELFMFTRSKSLFNATSTQFREGGGATTFSLGGSPGGRRSMLFTGALLTMLLSGDGQKSKKSLLESE